LKQCEPNVGLAMADFGLDPRSSDRLKVIVLKKAKLLTKFPGLATSGSHNPANDYKCRKLTAKWSSYGMSSFHFLPLESL